MHHLECSLEFLRESRIDVMPGNGKMAKPQNTELTPQQQHKGQQQKQKEQQQQQQQQLATLQQSQVDMSFMQQNEHFALRLQQFGQQHHATFQAKSQQGCAVLAAASFPLLGNESPPEKRPAILPQKTAPTALPPICSKKPAKKHSRVTPVMHMPTAAGPPCPNGKNTGR
jgi:hypothetical protein